jgi:Holliday junction resolvasome RuvABC ATP-dependent DNA helicase subunit
MKNQTTPTINTDVYGSFLQDINLWSVIGNQATIQKLQVLVDEYHNNQLDARRQKLKNILFCGKRGTGKTVLAHAYSNSLCCSQIFEEDGATLSIGGDGICNFLQQGDSNSAYMIHDAEKMTHYSVHAINSILKTNVLNNYDFLEGKMEYYEFKKLLILNCSDISKVNAQIVKNMAVVCKLNEIFTDVDIYNILLQRISCLSWNVKEKHKFIEFVVDVVGGNISLAIDILGWAHSCARAEGKDMITEKHLNQVLHIL